MTISTLEVGLMGMALVVVVKAVAANATSRSSIIREVDPPTRLDQTTTMEEPEWTRRILLVPLL
jgi:hypothetical protein